MTERQFNFLMFLGLVAGFFIYGTTRKIGLSTASVLALWVIINVGDAICDAICEAVKEKRDD